MSAFSDFLAQTNIEKFKKYREALISNRGNFSNGKFAQCMDIIREEENSDVEKLFVRRGSSRDCGFVFNKDGTEKAVECISQDIPLEVYKDFSKYLLFGDENEKVFRESTPQGKKKKLIASNLEQMIKKTDVNYRTLGDRLHYFTIGKIITIAKTKHTKHYPLFLFSCKSIDPKKQTVEVEATGFINFYVDSNIYDNEFSKKFGNSITIDGQFTSLVANMQQHLKSKNIAINLYDDVQCDFTHSSIGIITGFEPEYLDPVWDKILNEQ